MVTFENIKGNSHNYWATEGQTFLYKELKTTNHTHKKKVYGMNLCRIRKYLRSSSGIFSPDQPHEVERSQKDKYLCEYKGLWEKKKMQQAGWGLF